MNIKQLDELVSTALTVGIDSLVISENIIRGQSEEKTAFLIETENVLPTPHTIAIRTPKTLLERLSFFKIREESEIIFNKHSNKEFIKSITIKNQNSKIDYTCASPEFLQIPREIVYELGWEITIENTIVSDIVSGCNTIKTENIGFLIDNHRLILQITDVNDDKFEIVISEDCKWINDDDQIDTLLIYYKKEHILNLFKKLCNNDNESFVITIGKQRKKNILSTKLNGYTLYMLQNNELELLNDN